MCNRFVYLNDGKGYAWAGQARAKDSPPFLSKVPIDFESEENLGAAPPMGSTTNKELFLQPAYVAKVEYIAKSFLRLLYVPFYILDMNTT